MQCPNGHPLIQLANTNRRWNCSLAAGVLIKFEVGPDACMLCGHRLVRKACYGDGFGRILDNGCFDSCEHNYDDWHMSVAEKVHWLLSNPHPALYQAELLSEINGELTARGCTTAGNLNLLELKQRWPRVTLPSHFKRGSQL